MSDVAASAYNIRKHFEATTALDGVDFEVLTGEVHALVGENGAGKSTLVRILGGAVRPDEGLVTIGGRECRLTSPRDAIVSGVTTIPQELCARFFAHARAIDKGGQAVQPPQWWIRSQRGYQERS